jgi:hypothetical protein
MRHWDASARSISRRRLGARLSRSRRPRRRPRRPAVPPVASQRQAPGGTSPDGPGRHRPRGAKVRHSARARSRLLGTLDARHLHHHGALENGAQLEDVRKAARRCSRWSDGNTGENSESHKPVHEKGGDHMDARQKEHLVWHFQCQQSSVTFSVRTHHTAVHRLGPSRESTNTAASCTPTPKGSPKGQVHAPTNAAEVRFFRKR